MNSQADYGYATHGSEFDGKPRIFVRMTRHEADAVRDTMNAHEIERAGGGFWIVIPDCARYLIVWRDGDNRR